MKKLQVNIPDDIRMEFKYKTFEHGGMSQVMLRLIRAWLVASKDMPPNQALNAAIDVRLTPR